uniref:Ubiquitin-like protease family profile domain-containing protein n=2 Tax=Dendroctonus ponderosae TaxID=77166 RepID=A0AAR5P600_DENPD
MAQYFQVLGKNDSNSEPSSQFFNGNPADNRGPQVRYILAEDSPQLQSQRLVLSTNQVMVLNGSPQQIQGVVVDQGRSYQSSPQQHQQQFGIIHNPNMSNQQQIFYMETNSEQSGDSAVDQASMQAAGHSQALVLNHQMGANRPQANRPPRPVLTIRPPRHDVGQVQRPPPDTSTVERQAQPLQLRMPRPNNLGSRPAGSSLMRQRMLTPPNRPQMPQQSVRLPTTLNQAQAKNQQQMLRQLGSLHQKLQMQHPAGSDQPPPSAHLMQPQSTNSSAKTFRDFQQQQRQQLLGPNGLDEDELDDHDPAMNSSPGQLVNYKKMLEQRQLQIPILSKLPSNIKVTPASQMSQRSAIENTLEKAICQAQPGRAKPVQAFDSDLAQKTARASSQASGVPVRPRKPQYGFGSTDAPPIPHPPPRYSQSPPGARFGNQQQQQQLMHHLSQQPHPEMPQMTARPTNNHPEQQQQTSLPQNQSRALNNSRKSQINYLITPPSPSKPRQPQPLPSYIPSSQIQQIIGMFQETTPACEEFSDSIRMLVLLENGEQRLITFTLPKEACTIQEILEQVNVPFTQETNIQVTEANTNGINYIVTVGNVSSLGYGNEEEQQEDCVQPAPNQEESIAGFKQSVQDLVTAQLEHLPPELPKLIPGKLAVCSACGYTGEDFNKCRRCNRKLPDNVKAIETIDKNDTNDSPSRDSSNHASEQFINSPEKSDSAPKMPPIKRRPIKVKQPEESVVIISDEEGDEKKPTKSVSEQLLTKLGASISISPVTKEPSLTEIKKHVRKLSVEPLNAVKLHMKCRTVRIGSHRFIPCGDVILESKCVIIKAPVVGNKTEYKTVRIDRGDIVKVLICYNKVLPVLFYYINGGAAPLIRSILEMTKESGLYFDPTEETDDSFRKITLLPDDAIEEQKTIFDQLYGVAPFNVLEELTAKEANNILIKACPKESNSAAIGSFSEIKQILMYPKEGQGRLSINTEDYVCLAVDQFLNDKIIDFYLKYLWENLPEEQQEKVHVFSTFFYKRLTTKATKAAKKSHPYETDPSLTAAEKRHWRVKNWTKRINLFDKDFIIVPINENAHWFLAIICFPGMRGPQTFDGKPYNPEPRAKPKPKQSKAKPTLEVKKDATIPCDDLLLSDKDEAESEDSDMDSDDSEESAAAAAAASIAAAAAALAAAAPVASSKGKTARPPIKQPCILIFDSLAGPSRARVVATLRDYLTCEYKVKMDSDRVFNKDAIKGSCCKVPQQTNFTDCGLYVLQYVEQFFKDPITDYNIPIKTIDKWFDEIIVTKKREDICNLLKELMIEDGTDVNGLPEIALPTLNGKLVERPEPDQAGPDGEQEDMFTDIEDSEMMDATNLNQSQAEGGQEDEATSENAEEEHENSSGCENSSLENSPTKTTDDEKLDEATAEPDEQPNSKPPLVQFPKLTTNKDTLNYLKSKRIIRHKGPSDGTELKKRKMDTD